MARQNSLIGPTEEMTTTQGSRLFIAGYNARLVTSGQWEHSSDFVEIPLPPGMVIYEIKGGFEHFVLVDGKFVSALIFVVTNLQQVIHLSTIIFVTID